MTFYQIAQAIQDRDASRGYWLTYEQSKEKAVDEILEGFRDLDEARDWLEICRERLTVLFTGYGYAVGPEALEAAIKYQEDSNA